MQIAVTSESFSFHPILVEELQTKFSDVKIRSEKKRLSKNELISFLSDCDGAVIGLDIINEEILKELPKLKIVSKYGVGLDNLDLKALSARNIAVGWTPGVNKEGVSEFALGQMINLSRNLTQTGNELKNGKWDKTGGRELSEQVIGILGVGHIGEDLIKKLSPFGSSILACDLLDKSTILFRYGARQVDFNELVLSSDIISIHVPLGESTNNLFNKKLFSLLTNKPILINTSRGGIVNEDDLHDALIGGQIRAAAFDVYIDEPSVGHKLHVLDNFYGTPHIAGNSNRAVLSMGRSAISHLSKYFGK